MNINDGATGCLWICGLATKGVFISCPTTGRVRSVSLANRDVVVTLADGTVEFIALADYDGEEQEPRFEKKTWNFQGDYARNLVAQAYMSDNFGMMLTSEGEVFSWGTTNQYGQLGLGGSYSKGTMTTAKLTQVRKIAGSLLAKKVMTVAVGSYHAMAIDESNALYSWGRAFEGQAAQPSNMGVVLSPRLVHFSSENPVVAVSCGHNFTIAVLKNGGEVYAWGEGGCGQLGIGECVKSRDKPVRCSTLGIQKRAKTKYGKPRTGGGGGKGRFSPFIDVSCGWAHVLARNADGEVYVWGLNNHGQLGLGHTNTVKAPTLLVGSSQTPDERDNVPYDSSNNSFTGEMSSRQPIILKEISAYDSASAGVRPDGQVLSWGNNRMGRLGHGTGNGTLSKFKETQATGSVQTQPKLIQSIAGQRISNVLVGSEEIVAFAPTTFVKLEPAAGPVQGNSHLSVSGSGLWNSDSVIVRFEPIAPIEALERLYPRAEFDPFPRARSMIGKFHEDPTTGAQSISCRTPNMADTQRDLKRLVVAMNDASKASSSAAVSSSNNASSAVASSAMKKRSERKGARNMEAKKSGRAGIESDKNLQIITPPHPQPMTISVSMNGKDFVVVGAINGLDTAYGMPPGGSMSSSRNFMNSGGSVSSLPSFAGSPPSSAAGSNGSIGGAPGEGRRGPVTTLRTRGLGPQLSQRMLYSFYLFSPVQMTTVHPRLITLPSTPQTMLSSGSSTNRNVEPPVYLYIGGSGLYETNGIAVRFAAQGKPPVVCTDTSIVYLKASSAKEQRSAASSKFTDVAGDVKDDFTATVDVEEGSYDDTSSTTIASGSVFDDTFDEAKIEQDHDNKAYSGMNSVPSTGLYVRIRMNDMIRELDENRMLPFETISIGVALNGQDFVFMQGPRENNSVMIYRARIASYMPSVVPAIAPSSPTDVDTNSCGAAVVIKGSGFFKVANRPSCGGEIWHLRMRMIVPLADSSRPNQASQEGSASFALNANIENRSTIESAETEFPDEPNSHESNVDGDVEVKMARKKDGSTTPLDTSNVQTQQRPKQNMQRVGPDVLVPCHFESPTTLTALLPSLPLRGGYLVANKTRAKRNTSDYLLQPGVEGTSKWPTPWPAVTRFSIDICMAQDEMKLGNIWESKIAAGAEPLLPVQPVHLEKAKQVQELQSSSAEAKEETAINEGLTGAPIMTSEEIALQAPGSMIVYSLPGMTPGGTTPNQKQTFLCCSSAGFMAQHRVEIMLSAQTSTPLSSEDKQQAVFDRDTQLFQTTTASVRFALCTPDGTMPQELPKKKKRNVKREPGVFNADEDNTDVGDASLEGDSHLNTTEVNACEEGPSNDHEEAEGVSSDDDDEDPEVLKERWKWFVDVQAEVLQVHLPSKVTNSTDETTAVLTAESANTTDLKDSGESDEDSLSQADGGSEIVQNVEMVWVIRCRSPVLSPYRSGVQFAEKGYSYDPLSWEAEGAPNVVAVRLFVALNGLHFHEWSSFVTTPLSPDDASYATSNSKLSSKAPSSKKSTKNNLHKDETTEDNDPPSLPRNMYSFYSVIPEINGIDLNNGGYANDELTFTGSNLLVISGTSVVRFTPSKIVKRVDDIQDTGAGDKQEENPSKQQQNAAITPCILKGASIMTVIPNFGEDQLYVLIELFINGIGVIEEKPSFITRNWQYLGIPQEPDPELEEEEPDATEE